MFNNLHFFDFDALVWTDFNAAHAANALSCLKGVCLAVRTHLVNLNRTDVDTFSTAGAAIHVDID